MASEILEICAQMEDSGKRLIQLGSSLVSKGEEQLKSARSLRAGLSVDDAVASAGKTVPAAANQAEAGSTNPAAKAVNGNGGEEHDNVDEVRRLRRFKALTVPQAAAYTLRKGPLRPSALLEAITAAGARCSSPNSLSAILGQNREYFQKNSDGEWMLTAQGESHSHDPAP